MIASFFKTKAQEGQPTDNTYWIFNDLYLLHPSCSGMIENDGNINITSRQQWTSKNLEGHPLDFNLSFNKKINRHNFAVGSYLSFDKNGPSKQFMGQVTYAQRITFPEILNMKKIRCYLVFPTF